MSSLSPSELLGPLYGSVQQLTRAILPDSKTFADATPLRATAVIQKDWEDSRPSTDDEISAFIARNFKLPEAVSHDGVTGMSLHDHIEATWPLLIRRDTGTRGGSAIDLPYPYVVPGGRFRELYYWDSFFTMQGLQSSGRQDLVEGMIANFGYLLDRYGFIPNGTRTYYLSRSQPPVFFLMTRLSHARDDDSKRRHLDWMLIEHRFWMEGEGAVAAGQARRRVVRLGDGSVLNRYWDDKAAPRDESWREDIDLARETPERLPESLWLDLRAAAESGWDFSSRWMRDADNLGSIRTTQLLPIDLNCLMHGLEQEISRLAADLGEQALAGSFKERAAARSEAINGASGTRPRAITPIMISSSAPPTQC